MGGIQEDQVIDVLLKVWFTSFLYHSELRVLMPQRRGYFPSCQGGM